MKIIKNELLLIDYNTCKLFTFIKLLDTITYFEFCNIKFDNFFNTYDV